jgi:hypothetical protein
MNQQQSIAAAAYLRLRPFGRFLFARFKVRFWRDGTVQMTKFAHAARTVSQIHLILGTMLKRWEKDTQTMTIVWLKEKRSKTRLERI